MNSPRSNFSRASPNNDQRFAEKIQKVVDYNAEKIATQKNKSEKLQADLNEMLYTANMMGNLLRDLLDLAQLENNSFKIVNTSFSLP